MMTHVANGTKEKTQIQRRLQMMLMAMMMKVMTRRERRRRRRKERKKKKKLNVKIKHSSVAQLDDSLYEERRTKLSSEELNSSVNYASESYDCNFYAL